MKPLPKTTTTTGGLGGLIAGHGLAMESPWMVVAGVTVYVATLFFDWLTTRNA